MNECKGCIFVYQHDPELGSRAVVLEKPTAFTLSELAPPFAESVFAEHTVFLGGEVSRSVRLRIGCATHAHACTQSKPLP